MISCREVYSVMIGRKKQEKRNECLRCRIEGYQSNASPIDTTITKKAFPVSALRNSSKCFIARHWFSGPFMHSSPVPISVRKDTPHSWAFLFVGVLWAAWISKGHLAGGGGVLGVPLNSFRASWDGVRLAVDCTISFFTSRRNSRMVTLWPKSSTDDAIVRGWRRRRTVVAPPMELRRWSWIVGPNKHYQNQHI